jgi:hypothetical protein
VSLDALGSLALQVTFASWACPRSSRDLGHPRRSSTSAIWLGPVAQEFPSGGDLQRREMKRVVAFQRSAVRRCRGVRSSSAPSVTAASMQTWRVDQIELRRIRCICASL